MYTYRQLSTRALGVAFIAAPLLLVCGMLAMMLGVGVDSFGVASWVEGVFLSYAFLLFVPVFLGLAGILGARAPRLGVVTAVTGLGIGFGILPSNARIIQDGLARAGFDVAIFCRAGCSPSTSICAPTTTRRRWMRPIFPGRGSR